MDMERSTVVELDHPWYRGVKLYTITSGTEHNSKSYQRYLDCLDLANVLQCASEDTRCVARYHPIAAALNHKVYICTCIWYCAHPSKNKIHNNQSAFSHRIK